MKGMLVMIAVVILLYVVVFPAINLIPSTLEAVLIGVAVGMIATVIDE